MIIITIILIINLKKIHVIIGIKKIIISSQKIKIRREGEREREIFIKCSGTSPLKR